MADVFMLKKHHSINPNNKMDKNNLVETITFNKKNMKKIIFIKSNEQKIENDESKNEEEIKVIRQKEKYKMKDKKEIKIEEKEIKENKKNEIKINKEEIDEDKKIKDNKNFKEIKEDNNNKDYKDKEKNKENNNKENKENKEKKNNEIINDEDNKNGEDNIEIKEKKVNLEINSYRENTYIKDNKTKKDLKINEEYNRNSDIISVPKRKLYKSQIKKESEKEKQINNDNNKIIDLKIRRKNSKDKIINNNELNEEKNSLNINKKENIKIIIQTEKINNNNNDIDIEKNFSPKNNYKENNYLNSKKTEDERPSFHSIRRRFMNSKNKYNNFTPDIEIRNRNNNNELNKENKLNTFIDNSNNNTNLTKEKFKVIKPIKNIKKEESFKINISRIDNKDNNDKNEILIKNNTSATGEKDIEINKNIIDAKKEIKRVYNSPFKKRISKSPFKEQKYAIIEKDKKIENNNISILSDDEKTKEKEKEKIKEKKMQEDENIINRKKFQSESEKEKRIRRVRKYLQKEDRDKDKDKNNINKNEEEKKNLEITKGEGNKNKKNKKNEKIIITNNNSRRINNSKEKNINCFSMQNLFGLRKQNKNHNYKIRNENKNNSPNEKGKNDTNNSSINMKRGQYSEKVTNKKVHKLNKEEENTKLNEEEKEKRIKKKRKKDIPRKNRNKNYGSKLNDINNNSISNNPINNEEINNNIDTNRYSETNRKTKIKILEDVQIEEIDTTKPVVQINLITQIFFNNKNYKNIYLYSFDKKNNSFIQFDLRKKKFLKIKISDIEDLSDTFEKDYIYQNTILYNILTGVFILTGKNSDILYYYNSINETIVKVCQFKNNHNSGCLLLDKDNNRILILGGKNTLICESYSFDMNEIKELPNLNFDRCNSSFNISNNKIFGFFGFSYKKGKYLFNIEYIDKNLLDKWNTIDLNFEFKKDLLPFHLKNISTFSNENNPGKVLIYGGKQGRNEMIMDNFYYIYNIEKNNFERIEGLCFNIIKDFRGINIWKKSELIENEEKKGFFFDKEKQFIELPDEDEEKFDGNNKNICGIMDSECNVHFLTYNQKNINVYKFTK